MASKLPSLPSSKASAGGIGPRHLVGGRHGGRHTCCKAHTNAPPVLLQSCVLQPNLSATNGRSLSVWIQGISNRRPCITLPISESSDYRSHEQNSSAAVDEQGKACRRPEQARHRREHVSVELSSRHSPRLTLLAAHAIRRSPRSVLPAAKPSLTRKTMRLIWAAKVLSDG